MKRNFTDLLQLKEGKGLVKVNGKPLSLVQPEILRFKVYEPLLILGLDKFGMLLSKPECSRCAKTFTANVDIRVRVTGGGHTSQIYAVRQAIAKSIVSISIARNKG
jgi:small subunit ribosomal protein S16e